MSKDDPRPDKQRSDSDSSKHPDTGESPTRPAPGGLGTGTKEAPEGTPKPAEKP